MCNKLCYAVGGAPYQITGCALGFFLQIYLLDVAQVRPGWRAGLAPRLRVPELPVRLCPGDGAARGSAVPRPRAGPTRVAAVRDKAGSCGCFGGAPGPSYSLLGRCETGGKETTGGKPLGSLVLCLGSRLWDVGIPWWGSARRFWEPQIALNEGERPRDCSQMVVGSQWVGLGWS